MSSRSGLSGAICCPELAYQLVLLEAAAEEKLFWNRPWLRFRTARPLMSPHPRSSGVASMRRRSSGRWRLMPRILVLGERAHRGRHGDVPRW